MQKAGFLKKLTGPKPLILAGAAIGAIIVITLISKGGGDTGQIVYKFEKVTRGEVIKTISVSGNLEVRDSRAVLSKIGGVVTNVYVDFNQPVNRGQLLATIDASEIEQQLMREAARLEKANLDLEGARMDLETRKNLLKDNLISQKDYDQALLNYKKINSLTQQARVEYNIALKNKGHTRIYAPISGIIISRSVNPMEPTGAGKELFVIALDLSKMRLTINIDESDIGKMKKGQKVSFTVSAFPEKVFEGAIEQVRFRPIRSGGIVMYDSIVSCDNRELLLKPGMTATATVIIDRRANVLRVHNEALIISPVELKAEPGKSHVWVEKTALVNKLPMERCEIKPGLAGNTHTEVLSSKCVKEGDRVLINIGKKLEVKDTRFSK